MAGLSRVGIKDRMFSLACLVLLYQEPIPFQFLFNPTSHTFSCKLGKPSRTADPSHNAIWHRRAGMEGVGNFFFVKNISKKFPECIRTVYTSKTKKYSSISMPGIVGGDEEGKYVTADITVVFKFYFPYATKSSQSLTFIIGTGPNISLNGIVGLPWSKKVRAIFDAMDLVIEYKLLDVAPFPLTSMRAQIFVPEVSTSLTSTPQAYQAFYSDLENLKREVISSERPLLPSRCLVNLAGNPADSCSAVNISDPQRAMPFE